MRLTNQIKQHVLKQIVTEKIDGKVKDVEQQLLTVVELAIDTLYTAKQKQWIADAPTEGALCRIHNMGIQYKNSLDKDASVIEFKHGLLNSNTYGHQFRLKNSVPCFREHQHKGSILVEGKLRNRTISLIARLNQLEASKEALQETIGAALDGCTTVKKLEDTYPDLKKFLPEIKPLRQELTIPSDAISQLLKKAC